MEILMTLYSIKSFHIFIYFSLYVGNSTSKTVTWNLICGILLEKSVPGLVLQTYLVF